MTTTVKTKVRERQPEKKHAHERLRGGPMFVERWTNAKAAQIAFKTAQGRTSTVIAAELADGTMPETIRAMWKKWKLAYVGGDVPVQVPLSGPRRALLSKRAASVDMTPEQWSQQILEFAIRDDLFNAIVAG